MNFDLGENFIFNQNLAQDLIDNRSPIRHLPEHLLLLERVCHVWGRGDREWSVIRKSGERDKMSLRDVLKVPNFINLDFEFDELASDEVLFLKQISLATQKIRPPVDPKTSEATTTYPESKKEIAGLSEARVRAELLSVEEDSDPEVRELDQALLYHSSAVAAKAPYAPSATFSGGFLPLEETEAMETKEPTITSKDGGKDPGEVKVVTFSDVFSDEMEVDPATAEEKFTPDWDIKNKHSVMDDLTTRMFLFGIYTSVDHSRSRRMKSQDLGAAMLSNQAQSKVYVVELYRRRVEAESVKENVEKETISLKRKMLRTPDTEKKLAQLTQELAAQKEKLKLLTALN
ncbi:hypothetical protein Hdeb2414_s0135g00808311 [Helianthus debilis subsp. tardiflorus]